MEIKKISEAFYTCVGENGKEIDIFLEPDFGFGKWVIEGSNFEFESKTGDLEEAFVIAETKLEE